jgi:hypothetical protein
MKSALLSAYAIVFFITSFSITANAGFADEMVFTGTFESTYWDHDPDDWKPGMDLYEGPYSSFENQLMLHLGWRNWYSEIKFRNMTYKDGIHFDYRSREYETDFELFKYKLGYRGKNFEVVAGDFYQFLGRGIVLFVQEDKDLNLDRTIRGGHIKLNFNRLEARVFGGTIRWYNFLDDPANMTYEERKIADDVFGAGIGFKVCDAIRLGANYVTGTLYAYRRNILLDEDFQTGSLNLEAFGLFNGKIDLYGEYARLKWDSDAPYGSETEDGTAIYSSMTAYLGNFTILAEYKNYDYWSYRYGRPPTADREDEMTELDDTKGARIKVDYYIPSTGTLVYISASQFNNQGHPDYLGNITRNENEHFYAGIEQNWHNFHAHITYGIKEYKDIEEKHRRGTADLVYTFLTRNSLNLYYEYKFTGIPGTDKTEHKTYVTYSFSPYVALTAHYNEHVFENTVSGTRKSETWWAGEILITPVDTLTINLLYGGLPTGLICSGGQCRILPEFEGFQATLAYRF